MLSEPVYSESHHAVFVSILFLGITFLSSGCVTLPKYAPPTNGPKVKLDIANSANVFAIYFQDPYKCTGETAISSIQIRLFGREKTW